MQEVQKEQGMEYVITAIGSGARYYEDEKSFYIVGGGTIYATEAEAEAVYRRLQAEGKDCYIERF